MWGKIKYKFILKTVNERGRRPNQSRHDTEAWEHDTLTLFWGRTSMMANLPRQGLASKAVGNDGVALRSVLGCPLFSDTVL